MTETFPVLLQRLNAFHLKATIAPGVCYVYLNECSGRVQFNLSIYSAMHRNRYGNKRFGRRKIRIEVRTFRQTGLPVATKLASIHSSDP